jgi:hypothetical protein
VKKAAMVQKMNEMEYTKLYRDTLMRFVVYRYGFMYRRTCAPALPFLHFVYRGTFR